MGDWKVVLTRNAEKSLLGLERDCQRKTRTAIDASMHGDGKKLRGRPNQYRLRVGDHRVVFSPDYRTKSLAVLEVFGRWRGY